MLDGECSGAQVSTGFRALRGYADKPQHTLVRCEAPESCSTARAAAAAAVAGALTHCVLPPCCPPAPLPPPCLRPSLPGIEDPNPFFKWLMAKPFAQNVVWGPHFYAQVGGRNTLLTLWLPVSQSELKKALNPHLAWVPHPHATHVHTQFLTLQCCCSCVDLCPLALYCCCCCCCCSLSFPLTCRQH